MKLYNDKIRIIPFEHDHWPVVYSWAGSGCYDYFFGNSGPYTGSMCAEFNKSGINFIIVNSKNIQEVFGMISVSQIDDRSRNFHYNILVDKNHRRKGYAKEASELALFHMFNNLNYYKAIALVGDGNPESKALTEGFGFDHEAILKQEVYLDGEFKDVERFRMLKGTFNKLYKQKLEA